MTLSQSFIAELQMEAASTRKMLQRVPLDKSSWAPHEKSMKLGNLAAHVAEIFSWITMTLNTTELDFATYDYKPFLTTSNDELVAFFDKNVAEAVQTLENSKEEDFMQMWTMRRGEQIFFTLPKVAVLRTYAYSHLFHHRGQLSVYLRLLDVPVPGMYGPSADEMAPVAASVA